MFVPALLGLGTPTWDYGARGTLLGVTRGTGRPQMVRAVLEGVAHRGADLVEAAEADGGLSLATLRVDGGMSANPTFVQALADATPAPGRGVARDRGDDARRRVPRRAGRRDMDAATTTSPPRGSPTAWSSRARRLDRDRWREACRRAAGWLPDLSAIDF